MVLGRVSEGRMQMAKAIYLFGAQLQPVVPLPFRSRLVLLLEMEDQDRNSNSSQQTEPKVCPLSRKVSRSILLEEPPRSNHSAEARKADEVRSRDGADGRTGRVLDAPGQQHGAQNVGSGRGEEDGKVADAGALDRGEDGEADGDNGRYGGQDHAATLDPVGDHG